MAAILQTSRIHKPAWRPRTEADVSALPKKAGQSAMSWHKAHSYGYKPGTTSVPAGVVTGCQSLANMVDGPHWRGMALV